MAKHVALNNIEHKHLKVITTRSARFGDNLWYTPTFPSEFRVIQTCYPIFFQKNTETGKFFAISLFGFQDGENLFLNGDEWNASYIPLTVLRQPFLIGQQTFIEDGQEKIRRMMHIDLENPRVNTEEGELLFKDFGGNTEYLEKMATMLETIHHGLVEADQFIDSLIEYDLLEPFTLSVTLADDSTNELIGFYTLNEEKIRQLADEAIVNLHKKGHLESIYMVLSSIPRVNYLVEQKNQQVKLAMSQ